MGINIALIPLASMIPGKEVLLTAVTGNTMLNEQMLKPYYHSARKSDECAVFQPVTCVLSKAHKTRRALGPKDVATLIRLGGWNRKPPVLLYKSVLHQLKDWDCQEKV